MERINYEELKTWLKGHTVPRPNAVANGTLSGHAAGEPFEKLVYHKLKEAHPQNVFKQFEYLNDLYKKHPQSITLEDRQALFDSPVALFLLSRSDTATLKWSSNNIFEEKQNDTADVLLHDGSYFEIIDVKTRNTAKSAMPPNIISAYKVAQMCSLMIDNNEFDTIGIKYVEVDWRIDPSNGDLLMCEDAHVGDLFKAKPDTIYVNWAAAMQIQFHVDELNQTFTGSTEEWAKEYIRVFVKSAEHRINVMYDKYVKPFKKYIND